MVQRAATATKSTASKSGRVRTATNKQQQLEADQARKEEEAKKKALLDALRDQQKREEIMGFQKEKLGQYVADDHEGSPGPESEDGDNDDQPAFTSQTVTRPPPRYAANGRSMNLVRRPVPPKPVYSRSDEENEPVSLREPPRYAANGRNMNLVRRPVPPKLPQEALSQHGPVARRVTGSTSPQPITVMREPTDFSQAGTVAAAHRYTPPTQLHNGHGYGTDYLSRSRVEDMELTDDESGIYSTPVPPPTATAPSLNERIRKDPPTTTSPATTITIKRVKVEGSGTRGRIRASDFDDLTKSLIEDTISIYRAQIGTVEPWPDRIEDRDAVKHAWVEVCGSRNLRVELDEDIFKLVTNRASQARGNLKTISKPYVISSYKIETEGSKRQIRDQVEQVLDGACFIYKDPDLKTGIFRAPVIQTLINKTWFKQKGDDGVIHPEFSEDGMLPLVTIALVLTVVENNLEEWVTGEHVEVPFSSAAYRDKYRAHLKQLVDFEEKTRDSAIMPRLRKHMLKMARKHARVEESSTAPRAADLTENDIEAAKKEWETLQLSDEE